MGKKKQDQERNYCVRVTYAGHGTAYVRATSEEDAIAKVERGEMDSDDCIEVSIDEVRGAEVNE